MTANIVPDMLVLITKILYFTTVRNLRREIELIGAKKMARDKRHLCPQFLDLLIVWFSSIVGGRTKD